MPNRLANETSPYLLQHAENPVEWYAWGDEAFATAREEGKPIMLSVGYSACHWCHVMAHESFENPEIAAKMNELFVNIKVDREERPDVDSIYMQAVQSMTGHGGWPMTVFLTEEGVPFYGGTYYPPEDRHGMPGFPRVIDAVAEAYRERRQQIEIAGHDLVQRITAPSQLKAGDSLLTESILNEAAEDLLRAHDDEMGGFGRAPKFPPAMSLDFLLRSHHSSGRPAALEATQITLRAMANGGIYDQVGGGFHRYSTDDVWLVPHFEKMLYDNALLARTYLDAYKVTGDRLYRRITEETLDYVLREMTDPSGGFYSSQDADSEGVEGKFFLWTPAELEAVLGEDAALIGAYLGVTAAGNFEDSNILNVPVPAERFVEALTAGAGSPGEAPAISAVWGRVRTAAPAGASDEDAFEAFVKDAKAKLYAAREHRIHPGRDDKVLTAWNGLMQRAFAEAAIAFDSQTYREAAARNARFLLAEMRPATDGGNRRLLRTWKDGAARLNGYLEDYACLIDALLATHAATLEPAYLTGAIELAEEMTALFWDGEIEGFFDTGADHETLITRPRDFFDNATPSGTSVAIDVLLRLAELTDNAAFEDRAVTCLRTLTPFLDQAPTAFGRLLAALEFHLARSQEIAIVVPDTGDGTPATDNGAAQAAADLLEPLRLLYTPNLLLAGAPEGRGAGATPLLQDRPLRDGRPTAYVCERYVCQSPTTDPAELLKQVQALLP